MPIFGKGDEEQNSFKNGFIVISKFIYDLCDCWTDFHKIEHLIRGGIVHNFQDILDI